MKWNVFCEDINKNKIVEFDIFQHGRFKKDIEELLKENISKKEFEEKLDNNLRYYFWCKSEYEVVLTSWPPYLTKEELLLTNDKFLKQCEKYGDKVCKVNIKPEIAEKIDIYQQVKLNWDVFVEYVWSNKATIAIHNLINDVFDSYNSFIKGEN